MKLLTYLVALFLACTTPALAAFGVTETSSSYVLDSGSSYGFVVTVSRSDGSINSIVYRGTQYQYQSQSSHIASGLGAASVSYKIINNQYIKVTVVVNNADFSLTHYYVISSGADAIYMATDTKSEPSIGELRYIFRLDSSKLPLEYPYGIVSTTAGGTAIEASDVYSVNGQTRSKFYSSERFIDNDVWCFMSSSEDVHACFVTHPSRSYEKSSGGPFFRDINTNNGGAYGSLTHYMNSGHVQTESYRQGFHGPYALLFTRSGVPEQAEVDFSFFENLSISNYIPDSQRGTVTGSVSGIQSGFDAVVHWYNGDYQYWTNAYKGSFTSPKMVAGSYTMVLYQGELKVASQSVSVSAGRTTSSNVAASSAITINSHKSLFRIGEWDGRPLGFLNADKQLRMHPTDSRMSKWGPVTYTVGSSQASAFPMAVFKGVNTPITIHFNLNSAVASVATLRVGTTLSFAGGRPSVTVNKYSQSFSAPTKIDSRGVTRGAYRGNGEVYDANIPTGTLVSGSNTITIDVISGSSGDGFLNPSYIFDCVELFY